MHTLVSSVCIHFTRFIIFLSILKLYAIQIWFNCSKPLHVAPQFVIRGIYQSVKFYGWKLKNILYFLAISYNSNFKCRKVFKFKSWFDLQVFSAIFKVLRHSSLLNCGGLLHVAQQFFIHGIQKIYFLSMVCIRRALKCCVWIIHLMFFDQSRLHFQTTAYALRNSTKISKKHKNLFCSTDAKWWD